MAHKAPPFVTTQELAERVGCPHALRHMLTPLVIFIDFFLLITWPFLLLKAGLLAAFESLKESRWYQRVRGILECDLLAVFEALKGSRSYRRVRGILEYNLVDPRPRARIRSTGFGGRFPVLRWLLIAVIVLNWVCLITMGLVSGAVLCGQDVPYATAIVILCLFWISLLGLPTMIGQGRFDRLREACRDRRRAESDAARAMGASPTTAPCELWPACRRWSPILNEAAAVLPAPYMVVVSVTAMILRGRVPDRLLGIALIDLSLATAVVAACCFVRAFVRNRSVCQNAV